MSSEEVQPLACPTCARKYGLGERFCPECEMPLVYVGRGEEEPITEAHERARKVKPEYTGGDPVKVGFARNLAEAQMIQGILLEEGIPSILRRTRGFDVPDFLAAGPRDVLVPQAGAELAHELLHQADLAPVQGGAVRPNPVVLVAAIVLGGGGAALLAWILQGGS